MLLARVKRCACAIDDEYDYCKSATVNGSVPDLLPHVHPTQYLQIANNGEGSTELVVDGKAKDAHHGGTALVELDGALLGLLLLGEGVPAEVNSKRHVAEIAGELAGSGNVTHDKELEPSDEKDDLEKALAGDGIGAVKGSEAVGDIGELAAAEVDGTAKVDTSTGDDVAKEGKHGNAAVLDLNVTEAVQLGLVSVSDKAEGVEEAKRGLGTELHCLEVEISLEKCRFVRC